MSNFLNYSMLSGGQRTFKMEVTDDNGLTATSQISFLCESTSLCTHLNIERMYYKGLPISCVTYKMDFQKTSQFESQCLIRKVSLFQDVHLWLVAPLSRARYDILFAVLLICCVFVNSQVSNLLPGNIRLYRWCHTCVMWLQQTHNYISVSNQQRTSHTT